jgi:hypothetical protein
MAQLDKSVVTLRISGDDLIPDEITKMLRASPTSAQAKGDKIVGKKTGHVRIANFGMWQLCAADRKPEDIDGQIHEILGQATDDLAIWRSIAKKYDLDLFCGLFMRVGNEGLSISAASLEALGIRGIELGLDIYEGDDEEDDPSP